MSPFNILAVRFILAFFILAALFHKKFGQCSGQVIRNGVALGVTYTAVMGFEMAALQYTETSLASLIENSAFMLVPVFALALQHTAPGRKVVIGMLLSFGGLVVLMLGQGAAFNIGCIYLLIYACFRSSVLASIVSVGLYVILFIIQSMYLDAPLDVFRVIFPFLQHISVGSTSIWDLTLTPEQVRECLLCSVYAVGLLAICHGGSVLVFKKRELQ